MQPDIRYAQSSGAAIAYQVVGNADTDLVFVPDFGSNLIYGCLSLRPELLGVGRPLHRRLWVGLAGVWYRTR